MEGSDFFFDIGLATKIDIGSSNFEFKTYLNKKKSSIPKNIENELLIKNLHLANSALTIFQIEALKKKKELKINNTKVWTQEMHTKISEGINNRAWRRIDSLRNVLTEDYDTVTTNKLLAEELNLAK